MPRRRTRVQSEARKQSARMLVLLRPHVYRIKGAATGDLYELIKGQATMIPEEDLKPMLRRWAKTPYSSRPLFELHGATVPTEEE